MVNENDLLDKLKSLEVLLLVVFGEKSDILKILI